MEDRERIMQIPKFQRCALLQQLGWEQVAMLGLYIDAAPYTKQDPFYAYYWNSVFSPKRHLITIVRKRDLCNCGCGGRCTLQGVMEVIVWMFVCMRDGMRPRRRHDGQDLDARRQGTAGEPLPCRGWLNEFRADWMELAQGLGFLSWNSPIAPCFVCCCTAADMHVATHPRRTMQNYREAVQAATFQFSVNLAIANRLQSILQNDDEGKNGRRLVRDYLLNGIQLRNGDRLEVIESSGVKCDIQSHLGRLPSYPVRLVFFRRGGWLTSLNVLFDILDIEDICLDVLHIVDLGVAQYCVGWVFVMLCLADVYRTGGTTTGLNTSLALRLSKRGQGGYPIPPCRFCLHAKLCFVGMHDLELGWGIIRGNPWEKTGREGLGSDSF